MAIQTPTAYQAVTSDPNGRVSYVANYTIILIFLLRSEKKV